MALSVGALVRGLVQQLRPASINTDTPNVDVAARQWRYGELVTQPIVRKQHALADEGSYFVANNAQTAVGPGTQVAFTAVNPFILLQNTSPVATDIRVSLDYINLVSATAGSGTASTAVFQAAAVVLDQGLRFSSGGFQLTPLHTNMDLSRTSVVTCYAGTLTAAAATGSARTICGQRNIRSGVSTTVPFTVSDIININFGGVESAGSVGGTAANLFANACILSHSFPAVVIGPQQSALFYTYTIGVTALTAPTFFTEFGWWER